MNEQSANSSESIFSGDAPDPLREKLADAFTPGYQAELDPDEAERAGAFVEDALTEQDAAESNVDLVNATVGG